MQYTIVHSKLLVFQTMALKTSQNVPHMPRYSKVTACLCLASSWKTRLDSENMVDYLRTVHII